MMITIINDNNSNKIMTTVMIVVLISIIVKVILGSWPCMHAERHACMPLTGFLTKVL